jgi:hypothetical protein
VSVSFALEAAIHTASPRSTVRVWRVFHLQIRPLLFRRRFFRNPRDLNLIQLEWSSGASSASRRIRYTHQRFSLTSRNYGHFHRSAPSWITLWSLLRAVNIIKVSLISLHRQRTSRIRRDSNFLSTRHFHLPRPTLVQNTFQNIQARLTRCSTATRYRLLKVHSR